jgi:two-component system sensor histidine kinase PilS (NtrC family)
MNWRGFLAQDPVGSRWTTLVTVMLTRLLILAVIVLALSALTDDQVDYTGISAFLAIAFLTTIAYASWLRYDEKIRESILYQFAVDVLIITGLIHFTGGINSVLSLLYPLLTLTVGIVVSGKMALKVAVLSLLLYATLIVLEATNVLPYQGAPPNPYELQTKVYQTLMMQVLLFVIFAAAASYLSDQYLFQSRQLSRLRIIARATLDNVAIPLVAIGQNQSVVTANPAACTMLGMSMDELRKQRFPDLFDGAEPRLDSAEDASHLWWIRGADGDRIPVSYQASTGNFPAALVNAFQDSGDDVELTLVAMRDVTDLVNLQQEVRDNEKQAGAVDMITEMVHVVRNPLTAIRGASELINSSVEAALAHQNEITGEDFVNLKSLCSLITDQIQDLDSKVDSFMNVASGDRKKLSEILTEADQWANRILRKKARNHNE